MKEKYYEFTSFVLLGIVLIVLGGLLFFGKDDVYQYLVSVLSLVFLVNSVKELVRFFFFRLNKREEKKSFLSCFFHLFVCFILIISSDFMLGFIPFLFSIYLIIIGVVQFIMCFLEIRNGEFISFRNVIIILFCFSIAFPLLISPVDNLDSFLNYFSLYSFLLGLSMLWEAIFRFLSVKTKNKLKRKIRITLPKIVEAIIPYSIMNEINRNLALEKKQVYSLEKDNYKVDMDILIHTSDRGFNRMGHIDLCFDGMVISFGNYDEGSRKYSGLFGSGVLFMTGRKRDYINFCIENSKKTVFDFGIVLSDKQKDAVRKKIQSIMSNSLKWSYKEDKKFYKERTSYAFKLYKKTKARFYKFFKGRYRTYFVLGTNCCSFVDDVVGSSGIDILSINGIITPGTYYDYFNRELRLKHSNVVSKEIYNYDRMAKKYKK